jgi:hypothetical protein
MEKKKKGKGAGHEHDERKGAKGSKCRTWRSVWDLSKNSHTSQKRGRTAQINRMNRDRRAKGDAQGQNRHAADDLVAMIRGFPLFLSPFCPFHVPSRSSSVGLAFSPVFPRNIMSRQARNLYFLTRSQVFLLRAVAMPCPKRKRPFP